MLDSNLLNNIPFLQIIHRDLATRNVLVGERETCKVTDFGMARDAQQENIYEKKTKVTTGLKSELFLLFVLLSSQRVSSHSCETLQELLPYPLAVARHFHICCA